MRTAIHALWTLKGLNAVEGDAFKTVLEATKHAASGVRKTAVQILPRSTESVDFILKTNLLEDKEPLVVLNSLLALSEMPLNEQAEIAVLKALQQSKDINDRWIPDAFACILAKNNGKLLKKVLNEEVGKNVQSVKPKSQKPVGGHHNHAAMSHKVDQKPKTVVSPSQPDLVVTNIKIEPTNPTPRERITVSIEVTNQGGVDVPKGVTVPLNMRFEGKGQLVDMVSQVHTEGVKAQETVTITKNTNGPWTGAITVAGEQAGEYTFTVVVDKANTILEGNEKNNSFSKKLNIALPQTMTQYVLTKALRSDASVAPISQVIEYLRNAQKLETENFNALLKGISEG